MDYQDVLAALGAGSAHPGGFRTTLEWLEHVPIQSSTRILEVGCGTGRTSVYVQQKYDCPVIGVDVRREMVAKARRRAKQVGAKVKFVQASAERLPFPDASFDLVYMESVNVFVDQIEQALAEYHRVLIPGGRLLDVEMMIMGPVAPAWRESAKRVYGALRVPDLASWRRMFQESGFSNVRALWSRPVRPEDALAAEPMDENGTLVDPGAYQKPEVIRVLTENAQWMETNHRWLAYVVLVGEKPKRNLETSG
ncbi:class I SAM-dependent methyltransferase [Alicyclobacillus shizuokensis]|uniref:class I SAM-dependent methyltransferase n=1 Tax=Alicyclobacillus shizuokensis TaxID=392014 RepID=UPI000830D308|nr:class I SAM-dependent methyltransferase [Alicyclobacillus shizuokensis]MCL6625036.1 class I SAM-dependent methyltransferase [Alicyclobacillus shizuokensis]